MLTQHTSLPPRDTGSGKVSGKLVQSGYAWAAAEEQRNLSSAMGMQTCQVTLKNNSVFAVMADRQPFEIGMGCMAIIVIPGNLSGAWQKT
jgi:hypothetical protein